MASGVRNEIEKRYHTDAQFRYRVDHIVRIAEHFENEDRKKKQKEPVSSDDLDFGIWSVALVLYVMDEVKAKDSISFFHSGSTDPIATYVVEEGKIWPT